MIGDSIGRKRSRARLRSIDASAGLSLRHRFVLAVARLLITARHPMLVVRFARRIGYLPNPAAPEAYNERMLWRKIIDHNPLFVTLSDKLAAKDHVRRACPELMVPRTLWRGRDPDQIPDELLAGDVVVKTNHGCEMNIVVSDGQPDRATIIRKLKRITTRLPE